MADDSRLASALVIGEALVDVVARPGAEPVEHPGGSPSNVAVGLARLGRDVELITWFGRDERGHAVRGHLEGNGVRVSSASADARRTSTAHAYLDARGAATYRFDLDWSPPVQEPGRPPLVVHTGSIAAVHGPGSNTVAELVDAHCHSATIAYDPNIRPEIMTDHSAVVAAVEALIARADVVKASDEDLAWLYPHQDPLDSARSWLASGLALACVTFGGKGAWAATAAVEVIAPSQRVEVVDTVGAGDAFMGALIDALWTEGLLGATQRDALRSADAPLIQRLLHHASTVAAIVVSRSGANPPTRQELVA